ncbi:GntR family transcriptional regulator [Kitasatospora sp. NPDC051853]|uniref:GntR family transcriptional regulator n=1 Tax=Kitasatospora sp. NPDC051853 TaxID=3364058 RepID=UPI0037A2A1CD
MPEEPLHTRIARELRKRILDGDLQPGDPVPGENALMEQYSVARETARKALATLSAEGLTEARRGSRTRVRAFRPILRQGTKRLDRSVWGAGRSVWDLDLDGRPLEVDQLTIREEPCPEHLADALSLTAGDPLWVRERRYLVDGEPVMLATSYHPGAIVAGSAITREDTGPGGAPARLAELGFAPVRAREQVRTRMPLPDEAAALALGPGTPVALIVRVSWADGGVPVEVTEMTLDGSRYVMEWEFPV